MQALYTDAGLFSRNPSLIGGTFAWCVVEDDQIINQRSAIILPRSIPPGSLLDAPLPCDFEFVPDAPGGRITNNLAETMALVSGMLALPGGWRGDIYSDSATALNWVFHAEPYRETVTAQWLGWLRIARIHVGNVKYHLLAGHPGKVALATGHKVHSDGKKGLPVSKWNAWCDTECNRIKAEYLKSEYYHALSVGRCTGCKQAMYACTCAE
jgi:hypothetical protein